MSLPETPAGHDAEDREVQGLCVGGAEPVPIRNLGQEQEDEIFTAPKDNNLNASRSLQPAFCKASGQWRILEDSVCECQPGFEALVEENLCRSTFILCWLVERPNQPITLVNTSNW